MSIEQQIFKNGSTTYYWSSKFFPKSIRDDVFDLYSFVRVADDYVDAIPADKEAFYQLRRLWLEASESIVFSTAKKEEDTINERIVKNMMRLKEKYGFDQYWIESFLGAMQSDLTPQKREKLEDSLHYVHGSAETIGLMMAKIMGLPQSADDAAKMQGRAMQWLNFIRDLDEDNQLGRQYFPDEDLEKFSLPNLSKQTARNQPEDFAKFMHFQIDRYKSWQHEAEAGYQYIPKRLLVPLQTAAQMYLWTADQIAKDPLIVFEKKIKPSKPRIFRSILTNVA